MTTLEPTAILDLPMGTNDAKAKTIREYLKAILRTLLEEEESFSGKRPFGNSGWQYDLYAPLIKAGAVKGSLDENGYIAECDDKQAERIILSAIEAL